MADDPVPERLDVGLTEGPEGLIWISANSRLGVVHGVPRPRESAGIAEVEELSERFRGAVKRGFADQATATALGEKLRSLVFDTPEVRALFHRTRGVAAERGATMLVRMLATPRRIALYPWELMADPDGGDHRYLTLASDADVVRLARVRTYPVRLPQAPPPLRMLLVLSSPPVGARNETEPDGAELVFDLYEEKRSLLTALEPLTSQGYLEIDIEDRPTLKSLRDRVTSRQRGYHIVHYVGHATPDGLLLETSSGRAALTPPASFAGLLGTSPDLSLIFFAGCETAQSREEASLASWPGELSLAEMCVRDVCPIVVGMQALLPFSSERVFTTVFYQALTGGRTVSDSLKAARLAVRDGEHAPQGLLDWAIPCLFVAGEGAGRMVDAKAPTRTVERRRRGELKLDFVEGDREFFARDVDLRTAIDYLCGRTRTRALWVTGPAGVGKTRLIGRALEEVRDATPCTLYTPVGRLVEAEDPVRQLAEIVAEVFKDSGSALMAPNKKWNGSQWWERLLEEFREPFALVLDAADSIEPGTPLAAAVTRLAQRRTAARLVLIARERIDAVLGEQADWAQEIALEPLSWPDVWRWIRRNLPPLTQFDAPAVSSYFSVLGDRLDLWTRVAAAVSDADGGKLSDAVASVAPTPPPVSTKRRSGAAKAISTSTTKASPASAWPAPRRGTPDAKGSSPKRSQPSRSNMRSRGASSCRSTPTPPPRSPASSRLQVRSTSAAWDPTRTYSAGYRT